MNITRKEFLLSLVGLVSLKSLRLNRVYNYGKSFMISLNLSPKHINIFKGKWIQHSFKNVWVNVKSGREVSSVEILGGKLKIMKSKEEILEIYGDPKNIKEEVKDEKIEEDIVTFTNPSINISSSDFDRLGNLQDRNITSETKRSNDNV